MIPVCEPPLTGKELRYVTESLETNWLSSKGRFIGEFDERFAARPRVESTVAGGRGTVEPVSGAGLAPLAPLLRFRKEY